MPAPRQRVLLATVLLTGWLVGASAWFALVEGFTLLDAVYQTVITVSTVGFQEVRPLDAGGRAFTIVLILGGMGLTFYVAGIIVQEWVVGGLVEALGRRRMSRRVHRMHDHIAVCGFGRVGARVAEELQSRGERVVVVDIEADQVERARSRGFPVVQGDVTDEEVLRDAEVGRAKGLISALDSDTANTFVVVTARTLNADAFIIARAGSEPAERRMMTVGASRVISPSAIAGQHMALAAVQPMFVDFLDSLHEHERTSEEVLAELLVEDEAAGLAGRTLSDGLLDVRVLGLVRADGRLIVAPGGEELIEAGDRLMLYGDHAQIEALPRPLAA